jgi:calcineurin-like phosphoesterase family protein
VRSVGSRSLLAALGAGLLLVPLVTAGASAARPGDATAQRTLRALADATVSESAPRGRFGGEHTLLVSEAPETRAFLRFALPAGARSAGATLRLFAVTSSPATVTVRPVRGAWTERSVTYNKAPKAGNPAVRLRVRRAGWVTANVDRLVRRSGLNVALSTTSRRAVIFSSRETGSHGPKLIVQVETPPPPPPNVTIAAAANIGCDPLTPGYNGGAGTAVECHMRQTSDLLLAQKFDAVLALGDNQYECGSLSAYQQVFEPTWGRVKPLIHPVLGNHDYASPLPGTGCDPSAQPSGYFQYFGTAAGPSPGGYYSFDLGAWHLVALNANCGRVPGGCGAGSAQEQWLRGDLSASKATCMLAFMHHPRISSSYSADLTEIQPLWQALYDARAEVVLSGHDHVYERLAPIDPTGRRDDARGLRQFIVGTGGFSHHPFFTAHAASEIRNNDTFGVLKLELQASAYSWQFLPEAGKTFTDAGTGVCR